MKEDLQELRNALAKGERSIGALVYWRGLSDIRIDRATFRQGFRMCGLGKAVQRDPKPEASLNQAAAVASRRQGRESEPASVELKLKTDDVAQYAVLMRRDVGTRVSYLEEATISVERKLQSPTPTVAIEPGVQPDDQRDRIVQAVLDAYSELRGYAHTQEVSETLIRSMNIIGGISLRSGVYFVPAANMPTVKLLKAFIESNTSAEVVAWDIKATDENAREAQRDARESFAERVSKLVDEVNEFAATTSVEDVQMKSINSKMRKFKELDGKVSLFADILGDYVTELRKSIADAKSVIEKKFLGDDIVPVDDLDEEDEAA